jgi:hypothetical protein
MCLRQVDEARAGRAEAQAPVDDLLGGVGADRPELDAALEALAAPVDVLVARLAEDRLAGDLAPLIA